jgi:hypothetical protein
MTTIEEKKRLQILRKKAYQEAKERRNKDPKFLAMKEELKKKRKEEYNKIKAQRALENNKIKEKKKQERQLLFDKKIQDKVAQIKGLMKKGSDM